jgi:putative tricarboxylic transport membrane protein
MNGKILKATVVSSLAAIVLATPALAQDKIKYPVKTTTMIMQSSPGSGGDLFLRGVAQTANKYLDSNFAVENVTGGSGAKAMAVTARGPGDGGVLMGVSPTYVNTSLISKPPVTYSDLQPVVRLFLDSVIVFVKSDSRFKSLTDVVAEAKKKPNSVRVAVGEPGGLETQTMVELMAKTGTKVNVISHDGGGDALLSVLNGTGDLGIGEAAELKGQLDAGAIRPIVTYSEERIAGFPDLPTAREQGIDMVVRKFRGIIGPKNISPEAVKAWEAAVPKMLEDPDFKAWYTAGSLIPAFQKHEEFTKFINDFGSEQKKYFLANNIIKD